MARGIGGVDMLLPLVIIAVVAMMLMPLPSTLLDVLLTGNIAFAFALLIVAVHQREPEKFTVLPSILLLATLFRLGLNVSTTRQLLATGHAPATVMTFGNFVVQGNLVVGAVVFIIITLVQFIVIAKGAERVAEVAARFALDALPGKQMSIDADVRSGLLSLVEAKERRLALQRESRLYGALDGAMKFVKGDAIAGLFITLINICGGILIGMTRHNLNFEEALQRFALFTIGDGLVSQIPALLVAVAAGIVVTRVSDEQQQGLSQDLLAQLMNEPQAVRTTAGVIAIVGALPGMPGMVCWIMALGLFVCARRVDDARVAESGRKEAENYRPRLRSGLVVELNAAALLQIQQEGQLAASLQQVRKRFFEETGILVPDVQFETIGENGVDGSADAVISLLWHGVPMNQLSWGEEQRGRGAETLTQTFTEMVRRYVRTHRGELVDNSQTYLLLEIHRATAEELINSLIPQPLSVTTLTSILRQLSEEQVSIRSLQPILQAIAEFLELGQKEAIGVSSMEGARLLESKILEGRAQQVALLAHVRVALRRLITSAALSHCRAEELPGSTTPEVNAYLLGADYDLLFTRAALSSAPVDPEVLQYIAAEIRNALEFQPKFCVLTSMLARRYATQQFQALGLDLPVLATEELEPEVRVKVLGEFGSTDEEFAAQEVMVN